jgi:hypothetical protein
VPKFEIFDRSDFPDFYTIKPKIYTWYFILGGASHHLILDATAEHAHRFLTLSARISSLRSVINMF